MKIRSLRSQIIVFYSLLLAFVLALIFILVTTASYRIAHQQNKAELTVGKRVFSRLLSQNQQQLTQAASVLTADFGFLEVVTSNDRDTIISALNNLSRRIHANMMMLVSLDGTVTADTVYPDLIGHPAPIKALIKQAETSGTASSIMLLRNHAYQIIVVPVLAPTPISWIALGFRIDDQLAREIKSITSLEVSFLSKQANGQWIMLASTQPPAEQHRLDARLNQTDPAPRTDEESMEIGEYDSLLSILNRSGGGNIVAVLQRATEEAVSRFTPLRYTLLFLAILSLVLAVIGSFLIGRRITNPINALADLARHIQDGDYSRRAEAAGPVEVSELASSFNHMSDAIAFRESEIRRLAYEDKLTGLPNRSLFNEKLEQVARISARTGMEFSVILINIDRFKDINDTLGHEAGDEILKLVAHRLAGVVRESDTIACLGGDDFAILLTSGTPGRVTTVVHRIRHVLEKPHSLDGQAVDISTSIGIANAPEHATDASTLLRQADIALNTAKRNRTDYVIYSPDYEENRREHLYLLGELRQAVDHDQLELYYQPKLDLLDNAVVSVETLIRWNHPQRGLVSPGLFIPFAEHTGAIRMVTRWVIRAAVLQCSIWQSKGINLVVSLNISTRDLLDRELPGFLQAELQRNSVTPERLCLEITESALMEDPDYALSTVRKLHEMGVKLAIDDYGTGYSSLAYVKNLPVNELKIDRAFIMNMLSQDKDTAIVRSTMELGHNLGLNIVAEGVETTEQLNHLREIGCDYAQGYLISRPLPVTELEEWLTSYSSSDF